MQLLGSTTATKQRALGYNCPTINKANWAEQTPGKGALRWSQSHPHAVTFTKLKFISQEVVAVN